MMEKPGGREGGEENVKAFNDWVSERSRSEDWTDYVRRGQLNRSEIARECRFALSCFRSNSQLKSSLGVLEATLRDSGVLETLEENANPSHPGNQPGNGREHLEQRLRLAKRQSELRIKALEEQNAALKAEVRDLHEQLGRFEHLEEHLSRTGRMLHQ
jgi:hypothetical protein